jgi:hypothetical protein
MPTVRSPAGNPQSMPPNSGTAAVYQQPEPPDHGVSGAHPETIPQRTKEEIAKDLADRMKKLLSLVKAPAPQTLDLVKRVAAELFDLLRQCGKDDLNVRYNALYNFCTMLNFFSVDWIFDFIRHGLVYEFTLGLPLEKVQFLELIISTLRFRIDPSKPGNHLLRGEVYDFFIQALRPKNVSDHPLQGDEPAYYVLLEELTACTTRESMHSKFSEILKILEKYGLGEFPDNYYLVFFLLNLLPSEQRALFLGISSVKKRFDPFVLQMVKKAKASPWIELNLQLFSKVAGNKDFYSDLVKLYDQNVMAAELDFKGSEYEDDKLAGHETANLPTPSVPTAAKSAQLAGIVFDALFSRIEGKIRPWQTFGLMSAKLSVIRAGEFDKQIIFPDGQLLSKKVEDLVVIIEQIEGKKFTNNAKATGKDLADAIERLAGMDLFRRYDVSCYKEKKSQGFGMLTSSGMFSGDMRGGAGAGAGNGFVLGDVTGVATGFGSGAGAGAAAPGYSFGIGGSPSGIFGSNFAVGVADGVGQGGGVGTGTRRSRIAKRRRHGGHHGGTSGPAADTGVGFGSGGPQAPSRT